MTQTPRESRSGRKGHRRMFQWHARLISGVPSTRLRPTRESEAPVPALAPAIFCLGRWRPARRSPVRWWLRLWAFRPNALRSQWRETWISEVRLAYQIGRAQWRETWISEVRLAY